jgi:Tfp pilus assembly protein PilV
MRALPARRLNAAGAEAGLTIIEVLVAAVVLVAGAGAAFGLLGAATKNAQRAKATQVSLDLAQEELERLHSLPYERLALNSPPASSSDPLDPGYRVSGEQFALQRSPVGDYDTLAMNTETGIAPESEFFSGDTEHGGIKGTLYRYVVWRNDPTCPEEQCPGEEDYKQIVVAVKPDKPVNQTGERGYVEVQSELIDPAVYEEEPSEEPEEEGEGGGGSGNPGEEVTAQQFFLSDTPCAASGETGRQEITADHLLHNTLGTCASGLKTGAAEPGAPDALLLNGAPDPDPLDPLNPPLYDYANDFYLEPTPDTDKGLQIRRDDTSGCHYDPTGTTDPESQVHRWVTDPMPFDFEMTETVTFEFYTRTLNDALYTGTLCVFLFDREESGSPPEAEDTLLTEKPSGNAYWEYTPEGNGFWPRNSWTRVRLTMEFESAPHVVAKDDRVGIALGVDPGNTPADAIPIMYDHPNYPTRIEVDTETPIDGGSEEEGS